MDIKTVTSKYNFSILILRFLAICIDILVFLVAFLYLELLFKGRIDINIIITFFSIVFIYYALVEGITGYTWGKLVVGIKVVNEDLSVPGFSKGIARTAVKFLEFNPIFLLGTPTLMFILITKNKKRFGDILTNTYILRTKNLLELNEINVNKEISQENGNKDNSVKDINYKNIIKYKVIPIVFSIFFIIAVYKLSLYKYTNYQQILSAFQDKYQITVPLGWRENRKLNGDAALQASDEENKNYIIVICEEKQSILKNLTLDQYSKIAVNHIDKSIDNSKIISSTDIKINNYRGILFEITGVVEKTKVRYLYVILETKDNFNQIMAWTLDKNYTYNKEKLLKIIRSFKEDEEKLNKNESI